MTEHISILQGYIDHLEYMKKNADDFFDREQADKDIEAFKAAIKTLEQEPCEDAISRQATLEPYKILNDTDTLCVALIRANIMQQPPVNPQPCPDVISRQAVLDLAKKGVLISNGNFGSVCKAINELPPVNPQPKTGYISIDDVMSVFDDFMRGEADEDGTDTFLKMLKDRAESEG